MYLPLLFFFLMRDALGESRKPSMMTVSSANPVTKHNDSMMKVEKTVVGMGIGHDAETSATIPGTTQSALIRRVALNSKVLSDSSLAQHAEYGNPPTYMMRVKHPDFNVSIMVFRVKDMISDAFKHGVAWDGEDVKRICREFSMQGGHGDVLDIGANIGAYTLPLAACLKEHGVGNNRIISIEAAPWNAKLLRASIEYNGIGNVDLYETIVDSPEDAGVEGMQNPSEQNNMGMSHVSKPSDADAKVNATTIDAIAQRQPGALKNVFAMKIDIEGHEMKAFYGAKTFFKNGPCLIFIEMKYDEQNLTKFLQEMGYDVEQSNDNDRNAWCYRKDFAACVATLKAGPLDHQ